MKVAGNSLNRRESKDLIESKNFIFRSLLKEKILFYIFILLPIIDSLNGYFVRRMNIYGVGSTYHFFIIIILVIFVVKNKNVIIGKYERLTGALIIAFFLSFSINSFFGIKVTDIAIERSSKIICTAIMITTIYRLQKQNSINPKFLDNMLDIQGFMVPIIVLICNFSGLYNYSYSSSMQGRIGLYSNLNELVIIFTILLFHNIKKAFKKYTNLRGIIIIIIGAIKAFYKFIVNMITN